MNNTKSGVVVYDFGLSSSFCACVLCIRYMVACIGEMCNVLIYKCQVYYSHMCAEM